MLRSLVTTLMLTTSLAVPAADQCDVVFFNPEQKSDVNKLVVRSITNIIPLQDGPHEILEVYGINLLAGEIIAVNYYEDDDTAIESFVLKVHQEHYTIYVSVDYCSNADGSWIQPTIEANVGKRVVVVAVTDEGFGQYKWLNDIFIDK